MGIGRVGCSLGSNQLYDPSHIMASAEDKAKKGELNDQLKEYIHQRRDERAKEEEELKRLKEKQDKRKEIRIEQEKKLAQQKRAEEEKARKEEAEKREAEALEKMMAAQKEKGGKKSQAPAMDARKEMSKSKEQVEEEMKISLSIRIKPLALDEMDSDELRNKANQIWNTIVVLETDKYDYEQRQLDQDYEFKELAERQKLQLRNKAIKKGLDPESFTGAHPPTIHMFSKYERRTDTRTYGDRKKLYEGGAEVLRAEALESSWKEKLANSRKDQRPGFQNGLVSVPVKKQEIQIHLKARRSSRAEQEKALAMKKREEEEKIRKEEAEKKAAEAELKRL